MRRTSTREPPSVTVGGGRADSGLFKLHNEYSNSKLEPTFVGQVNHKKTLNVHKASMIEMIIVHAVVKVIESVVREERTQESEMVGAISPPRAAMSQRPGHLRLLSDSW